jgi:hypothetical protein
MKTRTALASAAALAAVALMAHAASRAQDAAPSEAEAMAAMMAQAERYTRPGEEHAWLERLVGSWTTETRLFLGGKATPAVEGTAKTRWLMEGRWLQSEASGSLMGAPFQAVTVFGYDNFKQSYVAMQVTSMDTAMYTAEGDLTPGGDTLILYGTVDEYLTGEHDKMVKLVYRMLSEDAYVMEVHDLPIGEENTKVIEVRYERS